MADTTPTHRTPTYLTPPHLHILHQHIWHQHMAHSESHVYICIYTYIYIFAILHGHIGRHLMAHSELYLYLNICMSHSTTTHRTPTYGTQWIACVYIYICVCHSTPTYLTPTYGTQWIVCVSIYLYVPFYNDTFDTNTSDSDVLVSDGRQWIAWVYIYMYMCAILCDTSDTKLWHTVNYMYIYICICIFLQRHIWHQHVAHITNTWRTSHSTPTLLIPTYGGYFLVSHVLVFDTHPTPPYTTRHTPCYIQHIWCGMSWCIWRGVLFEGLGWAFDDQF